MLVTFLKSKHFNVFQMQSPNRNTTSGKKLDVYLKGLLELSREESHLLFSENRWEAKNEMEKLLEAGTTIVFDRYSYSGIAYSAAKGVDFEWCRSTEKGFLRPDIVFYLKTDVDTLVKRSGFGEEKDETPEIQKAVSIIYDKIYQDEQHYLVRINASDNIATIHKNIAEKALKIISQVGDKPIQTFW